MKLNIWKNQRDIEKTLEVENYDLMYGTVEDVLDILDELTGEGVGEDEYIRIINANRDKLNDLLLDIFPDMEREDLRKIKISELIPVFMDLFGFVRGSLGEAQQKN